MRSMYILTDPTELGFDYLAAVDVKAGSSHPNHWQYSIFGPRCW